MNNTQKNLVREVFMRNGFTIKDGRDDLADYVYAAASDLLQSVSAVQEEPVAWLPYLTDRADGVTGHYAIARKNPAGYREVWNLRSHRWAAFSDEVLTLDEALAILKKLEMPTALQPSFQLPGFATDPDDSDEGASLWDHGYKRGWNACVEAATKAIQPAGKHSAPDVPGLTEALRQYQHNDGSGLVFGYDKLLMDQHVAMLVEALEAIVSHHDEYFRDSSVESKMPWIKQARSALAAYHKVEES